MSKKVLITGGCGFIGSNFVHYLYNEKPDWELHIVDSLTYCGNLENISSLLETEKVFFHKINICDSEKINTLFKNQNFDVCFHLAAESHVDRSIHSATQFVNTNVIGTQVLIDAARMTELKTFIHVSTDEVYGSLGKDGKFFESTILAPSSVYSASKASSDLIALSAFHTYQMDVRVTRCTNNYGPYQFPEKLIPLFISNLLEGKKVPVYGDGSNIRSWIYVTDHCSALLKVYENGAKGEVYNIGGMGEAEITNLEMTKRLLKALNKDESFITYVEDRLGHDFRYSVDVTKANNELNWEVETGIEEGLEKTVNWYLENQQWWTNIKSGEYQNYYKKQYGNG